MAKTGFLKRTGKILLGAPKVALTVAFLPVHLVSLAMRPIVSIPLLPVFAIAGPWFDKKDFKKDSKSYRNDSAGPLTTGEVAFVESIFGKQIKTGEVKRYFSLKDKDDTLAQAFGAKSIKFYGLDNFEADYSQPKKAANAGTFIHEMTQAVPKIPFWQTRQGTAGFSH